MDYITNWIFNIIIFLLLAMIIDMILPESDMRKYAKLVTGLLLISIIVTPLFKIFTFDFEKLLTSITTNAEKSEQSTGILIERKKREIQASQHAYTLEQMAVQMKKQVEKELIDHHQAVIKTIQISADSNLEPPYDQLKKVIVHISSSDEKTEKIQPVTINIKDDLPLEEQKNEYGEIKKWLSAQWEIPEKIIEIVSGEEPK
ncbi:stage III sporulation protein AF [Bacillus niameyensis]|uniref:stage III sporulation protein AF n=1 Tax=Bacillus niameyensis TaxID=1522308 RepID=UPI0007810894|nr:stage III sporulation protein AF [Bacillus niameyensis]